jgi:short chain dehydrogenase
MAMNKNGSYAGKVAFVTGAASGIGRATALAFAREVASVLVADVSEQGNEETARMIENEGGLAIAVRCDVTQAKDVKAALAKAVEVFGRLNFALQRRCGAEEADRDRRVGRGGVEPDHRHQPPRRVPVHEARDPADPQAGRWRDRQHVLRRRNHRHQGQPRVHRREARRDRPHPIGGPRLRRAEHPRQRRLSRLH